MKSIKQMIHPYIFVLKEGTDIEYNRLDYTLMMLKIGPAEHFPSPAPLKRSGGTIDLPEKKEDMLKRQLQN